MFEPDQRDNRIFKTKEELLDASSATIPAGSEVIRLRVRPGKWSPDAWEIETVAEPHRRTWVHENQVEATGKTWR